MILPAAAAVSAGAGAQQSLPISAAVEPDVDVAVAGHFQSRDAWDRADFVHQFGGDLPRRLSQLFGQLERGRHGHFAEIALLGLLDGYCQIDAVARLDVIVKGALNLLFERMKHLREILRIEDLLDSERTFGGEGGRWQASLDCGELCSFPVVGT